MLLDMGKLGELLISTPLSCGWGNQGLGSASGFSETSRNWGRSVGSESDSTILSTLLSDRTRSCLCLQIIWKIPLRGMIHEKEIGNWFPAKVSNSLMLLCVRTERNLPKTWWTRGRISCNGIDVKRQLWKWAWQCLASANICIWCLSSRVVPMYGEWEHSFSYLLPQKYSYLTFERIGYSN